MKKKISVLLFFLCLPGLYVSPTYFGGDIGVPGILAAEKRGVVNVEVLRGKGNNLPGSVRLLVKLTVDRGWHINSHRPLDEFLIPTTVDLDDNPHWKIGEVSYPAGEKIRLSFSPQPVSVYEGTVKLPVTLRAKGESPPRTTLKLLVGFQPCDKNSCVAPETVELSFAVGATQDK